MVIQQVESNLSLEKLALSKEIFMGVIAGRNILFSEADQRLFEINDMAAYIWRSIEDGLQQEAILNEMVAQGLNRRLAETYLNTALLEWTRLGLMRPEPRSCVVLDETPSCQDVMIAGISVRIRYAASVGSIIAPIFEHLESKRESRGAASDMTFDVCDQGEQIHVLRNGSWLWSCPREEIATTLKGQLLDEVLESADYELAFHAAALVRNGRMLLVGGHPGAGKTTLTLALVNAGFGFAGDDLALLHSDGQVTGVPFAPAVKAGAWELAARYRPDIHCTPIFRRPDRKRVRYPTPVGLVPAESYPVGWLMVLDRRPGAGAALTPIDPIRAVGWMLQDSYAQSHRLTPTGFNAIRHAIEHAEYYRLTYSHLEDAVELLHQICR